MLNFFRFGFAFSIVFSFLLFSIGNVSAIDIQLLCLNGGQTIKFSQCNPVMQDRTCSSGLGCQYCVTYNEQSGVYCPANINICNTQPNIQCSNLVNLVDNANWDNNGNNSDEQDDNNISIQPINNIPKSVKADVAYVVKNELGVDSYLLEQLKNNDYSYEMIYESNVGKTDFSNYYIIIVGNQKLDNPAAVPVDRYKSLIINSYNFYKKNLDWQLGWSGRISSVSSPSVLNVRDSSHKIVSGIPRNFKAYSVSNSNVKSYILKGEKPVRIEIIAYSGSLASDSVIAAVSPGIKYLNGKTAQERGVFFGITNAKYWTSETKKLFKNSLNWLIEDIDNDGDGFPAGLDCNDSNPNINPEAEDPALDCVNNRPEFIRNIEDITWNEDVKLNDYIDLEEHFVDFDSELQYGVEGNKNINVIIQNGKVSFIPIKDWSGTEKIIFSAKDSEFTVKSNEIKLTVREMGEPPVLEELNCNKEINEDEKHSCSLDADDLENDAITFSVRNEVNLDCEITGNNLEYISAKDYNGVASCEIVASDKDGEDVKKLEIKVLAVNDVPRIKSAVPDSLIARIVEGQTKTFKLEVEDIDKDNLNVVWNLDNVKDGDGVLYNFKRPKGVYNLYAVVSDSILQTDRFWSIIVGNSQEFTCSELNGFTCSESQTCSNSNSVASLDSPICCLSECTNKPAQFKDVEVCKEINESLKIEIDSPTDEDNVKVGEILRPEIEIDSGVNEDLNLDVDISLYNVNEEKSIVEDSGDVKLEEGRREIIRFELDIPEDLDLNDNYVLFVRAKDGICNQVSMKLDLERPKDKIMISEFSLPEKAVCGDTVSSKLKVENFGSEDRDVVLSVRSNKLNINEKTETIELEEFGNDDSFSREFKWALPANIETGEYTITALVEGSLINVVENKKIDIECGDNESEEEEPVESRGLESVGAIKLNNDSARGESKENNSKGNNVLLISIMLLATFVGVAFLFFVYYVSREKKEKTED